MRKLTFLAVSLFALASCVGQVGPSGEPIDDDPPVDEPPPDDLPPPPPAGPPCVNAVADPALIPDGHHFPGQDCMGSCHDHGFTLGGTLLKKNLSVYPGGIVTVVDKNLKRVDITAGNNGNFYTSEPLVFPITTYASACPDVAPMISEVKEGEGGCAKSGCHTGLAGGISEITL
jgi:hypothetical protein